MIIRIIQKLILIALITLSASAFAEEKIDWDGFYGSAMIGRVWGHVGDDTGTFNYVGDNFGNYQISGIGSSFDGFSANLKIGYNKQLDTNLIGIELGGSWQASKANGIALTTYNGGADSTPYSVLSVNKIKTYETLSARIGHIFNDKTLVYISGGGVVGQIKSTLNQTADASDDWLAYINTPASVSDKKNEFGYTLGFGVEHKFNDKWALRANYEYINFGKVNLTYQHRSNDSFYDADINLSNAIHFSNLSAGVSYAF
jgi:outer membrane immunogenic protein